MGSGFYGRFNAPAKTAGRYDVVVTTTDGTATLVGGSPTSDGLDVVDTGSWVEATTDNPSADMPAAMARPQSYRGMSGGRPCWSVATRSPTWPHPALPSPVTPNSMPAGDHHRHRAAGRRWVDFVDVYVNSFNQGIISIDATPPAYSDPPRLETHPQFSVQGDAHGTSNSPAVHVHMSAWPNLAEVRKLLRLQPDPNEDSLIQTALAAAVDYGMRRLGGVNVLPIRRGDPLWTWTYPADTVTCPTPPTRRA